MDGNKKSQIPYKEGRTKIQSVSVAIVFLRLRRGVAIVAIFANSMTRPAA